MEEYNFSLPSTAYHCGGLMAVYAAIQKAAMPDVNTGIVERYYASAIQMPALVIGQLSSRSNHHLEKMENKWLANQYQEKLRQVSVALGTSIPATLNLEQQSYFALGYYQMGAKLSQEKKNVPLPVKKRQPKNKGEALPWLFRIDMNSSTMWRAPTATRTAIRIWEICPALTRRRCRAISLTALPSAASAIM